MANSKGCGCSGTFFPNPGSGIDAVSNAIGNADWHNGLTENLPPQGIEGRSPYGDVPTFGEISFCRKCFLTWAIIFIALSFFFFYKK